MSARRRDEAEADYRSDFVTAVIRWLAFAPIHASIAPEIAAGAAEQAVVVGSERVGRTNTAP